MGQDRGYKIVATGTSQQGACQFGHQVGDTVPTIPLSLKYGGFENKGGV